MIWTHQSRIPVWTLAPPQPAVRTNPTTTVCLGCLCRGVRNNAYFLLLGSFQKCYVNALVYKKTSAVMLVSTLQGYYQSVRTSKASVWKAFLCQVLWDLEMCNSEVPFGVEKANASWVKVKFPLVLYNEGSRKQINSEPHCNVAVLLDWWAVLHVSSLNDCENKLII